MGHQVLLNTLGYLKGVGEEVELWEQLAEHLKDLYPNVEG